MTDTFQRNLAISGGLHLAVVAMIFFKTILVPSEPIEIRRAIRVDIVRLPQKITEPVVLPPEPVAQPVPDAAPPKPAPPVKELPPKAVEAPKPKGPSVDLSKKKKPVDTKKAQQEALNRLKANDALAKIQEELAKEKAKAGAKAIAGNEISKGNSLTGIARIEYDRYASEIESKIRANWALPQWLAEAKLSAQVRFLVDADGTITRKTIVRSSGNQIFDQEALTAVANSSPLPPPPQRLVGALSSTGITVGFPE